MPLIDNSRSNDAVQSSICNGISHTTIIESVRDPDYRHNDPNRRQKIVIVGLGMVAISFIEKIVKQDAERRKYDIVVIGEEPHIAYNRVGLSSFFEHRKIEDLYLNPKE